MASVVLIARVALFVVFATAACAKLSDLQASSDTVEAFGLPRRLATITGRALPVAELAVAVALLPLPSARWGAAGAGVLLVVFSAGVAYALSQGRTPDCNCFGQVSSEQIGWRTLARNAMLIAVSAFGAVAGPGASLSSWTRNIEVANVVSSVAVIAALLLAVAVYALMTRAAVVIGAHELGSVDNTLPPGAVAPDFELADLDGRSISRDALLARGLPVVLVFASPTCAPCWQFLPELKRWNETLGDAVTIAVIESEVSDAAQLAQDVTDDGRLQMLIEPDRAIAEAYFVAGTPSGISISHEGLISSPPVPGRDQIEQLIRTVLRTGGTVPEPLAGRRQPARA